MPKVSSKEFFNKIKSANLFCIYGEERYLVHKSIRLIIENALGTSSSDFNVDAFYSDADNQKVISSINTLPIMSHKRVVVIKDIESCTYLNELKDELENISSTTVLVLTGYKIDLRKNFFKSVIKHGLVVEFSYLKEDKLLTWVHKKFNEHKRVELDASKSLLRVVGNNMYCLDNEIMKLVNFVGTKETIEIQDIHMACSKLTTDSIFNFSKYLVSKNRRKALHMLNEILLNSDSNPIGILALIKRHFRILILLKEEKNATDAELSSLVGVPRYFLRDYIRESDSWDMDDLKGIYDLLFETDVKMKSSYVPDDIFLTNLVLKATSSTQNLTS